MTNKDEKEWRELCALAAVESNPERLSELVEELIGALDARKQALRKREGPGNMLSGSATDDTQSDFTYSGKGGNPVTPGVRKII